MKKYLAIALCFCVGIGMLTGEAAASFPDVDEDAAYAEAAEYLNEIGVMQGDAQGNFNPDNMVTRAQMAAIICRMLGETEDLPTDGNRFTDVPEFHWANGYIVKAEELGIINGYQDGRFKPENTVTYEQAITMAIRAIGGEELAQEGGGYPYGYLEVAESNGLLAGLPFQSGANISRANIAILLHNCII